MPKYKSLLSGKPKKGGSKSGGSTSGGSKSAGSTSGGVMSAGLVLKKKGGVLSAGILSAGSAEKYEATLNKFMNMIEKNPMIMLDLLEHMDTRCFHILKEIAHQSIGNKSPNHPQYVEKLKKSDDLYHPFKDIANNARSLNHLIQALKAELSQNPSGGGLFKSIWKGIKKSANWVNNNVIKKIPSIDKIQSGANNVINKIRPIVKGIDEIGQDILGPEMPQLTNFVDRAKEFVNNETINKASRVQKDINKLVGNQKSEQQAPEVSPPPNIN